MTIISNTARYCGVGRSVQRRHHYQSKRAHSGLSVFFNFVFALVLILMSAKLLSLLEVSLTNSIDSVSAATYRDTIVDPYYYTAGYELESGWLGAEDLVSPEEIPETSAEAV
jgi:hypothetical protein